VLRACYFVAGCSVILRNLGLDDNVWIEFARNNEIGRLIESGNTFRTPGLSITCTRGAQDILFVLSHHPLKPGRLQQISFEVDFNPFQPT